MNKLKTMLCVGLLALAGPAFSQLTVSAIPTDSLSLSLQSDPALLGNLTANTLSFESGGVLWEQQANFALGDFIIGNTEEGAFFADVSFLGRDSMRPNHFGVSEATNGYGAGGITLFEDYVAPDDFAVSYRVSAAELTPINFFHFADKVGEQFNYWHDDISSVRTWTSFNSETNILSVLFGWDDLHGTGPLSDDQDYNDGAFKVDFNFNPVDFTPVPEPSTFALWGGAMILAAIAYRRRFGKQLSADL